jgi:hypothetical protein
MIMMTHTPDGDRPPPQSQQRSSLDLPRNQWLGVLGNERLTVLTSSVLLAVIGVEMGTSPILNRAFVLHVVVGVGLCSPLAVKLGSTGYRFVRYYTHSPAYVRRGPPRLFLRVLGPILVAVTLVMMGSGIGLLVWGPLHPFLYIHVISALIWLPLIVVHVVAHIPNISRSLTEDWGPPSGNQPVPGRGLRLGVNLGALAVGTITTALLFPAATPLFAWSQANVIGPGPFLVGMGVAALALLVTQPWRLAGKGR